jgi:hypothetical protein
MLLTAELLADLVKSLRTAARVGEKRQTPRVGLRAYVDVILPGKTATIEVGVRDIGPTGIGIMSPDQLTAGQSVQMLCKRLNGKTQTVHCVVRHCRKTGGPQFSVGLTFEASYQKRVAA